MDELYDPNKGRTNNITFRGISLFHFDIVINDGSRRSITKNVLMNDVTINSRYSAIAWDGWPPQSAGNFYTFATPTTNIVKGMQNEWLNSSYGNYFGPTYYNDELHRRLYHHGSTIGGTSMPNSYCNATSILIDLKDTFNIADIEYIYISCNHRDTYAHKIILSENNDIYNRYDSQPFTNTDNAVYDYSTLYNPSINSSGDVTKILDETHDIASSKYRPVHIEYGNNGTNSSFFNFASILFKGDKYQSENFKNDFTGAIISGNSFNYNNGYYVLIDNSHYEPIDLTNHNYPVVDQILDGYVITNSNMHHRTSMTWRNINHALNNVGFGFVFKAALTISSTS